MCMRRVARRAGAANPGRQMDLEVSRATFRHGVKVTRGSKERKARGVRVWKAWGLRRRTHAPAK
jgi:hypothetical protein